MIRKSKRRLQELTMIISTLIRKDATTTQCRGHCGVVTLQAFEGSWGLIAFEDQSHDRSSFWIAFEPKVA
jgi:hypothetical protein